MTNKEILQADMLDILFEHRNKLYGAYALRKTYTHRLGLALGISLSLVLLVVLMSIINKDKNTDVFSNKNDIVQLIDVNLVKPEEPELPKPKPEIKPPQATVDYQAPVIVDDDQVKEVLVDVDEIAKANVGNENIAGDIPDGLAKPITESPGTGSVTEKEPVEIKPELPTRNASFPGGTAAWLDFLRKFLQSPEDMEPGQRIEVQVRFWIGIDGVISNPEIVKSGGKAFDKEVLRVLKRMPRWEPAIQNGNYVAVTYTQPVIFIGVE